MIKYQYWRHNMFKVHEIYDRERQKVVGRYRNLNEAKNEAEQLMGSRESFIKGWLEATNNQNSDGE